MRASNFEALAALKLAAGEHKLSCEAFLAVAELIQLLSDGAAGWQDAMTSKCHWPLRIADCFGVLGFVPACFTVERKHKLVKRYATWQQNTTNFEYACMKVVLADDLHKLTAPMVFAQEPALVAPVSPAKSIGWAFVLLGKTFYTSTRAKLAKWISQQR